MSALNEVSLDLGKLRNLSEATLAMCGVRAVGREHPYGIGWVWNTYTLEGVKAERWKSVHSQAPGGVAHWAKYRWHPEKPTGNAGYFDPDYKLRQAISANMGVLYLVGGEIAAMSMFESERRNSTCFFGDTNVPATLYEDLRRLGVKCLLMIPDRDKSGLECAQRVRDLISHDLDFEFTVLALPYELTEKHGKDVNDLWLQYRDGNQFDTAISNLSTWKLPEPKPQIFNFPTFSTSNVDLPQRFKDALIDDVTRRADHNKPFRWGGDGWSNNFKCPFHDDKQASAGFNKDSMSFYCFGGCGSKSAKEYGEGVGILLKDFYDEPIPIARTVIEPTTTPTPIITTPPQKTLRPALPLIADLAADQRAIAKSGRKWLDDYLVWTKKSCPLAPEIFHEAMALWLLATVSTRRMKLVMGGQEIYPNLYVMVVAKTSLYRKSTAMNEAKKLLKQAGLECLLLPTDVTPEALFDELAGVKPVNFESLSMEDRREWLMGRAVAAQRAFIKDECSSIFANLKKDYNAGLTELLLEGYQGDGGKLRKLLKSKGLISVKDMCLSFLGATTPVMYAKYITNEETENGFVARFAIVTPEGLPVYETVDEPVPVPPALVQRLRNLFMDVLPWHNGQRPIASGVVSEVITPPAATVTVAPEAMKQLSAYRKALNYDMHITEQVEETKAAAYTRLGTMVLKVAMLLAAVDNTSETIRIEPCHAYAAQLICERWRESLHRLERDVAKSMTNDNDKVLNYLRGCGLDGATMRDLQRDCSVKQRNQLENALKTLSEDNQIEKFEYKHNGAGRPSIRFRVIPKDGN